MRKLLWIIPLAIFLFLTTTSSFYRKPIRIELVITSMVRVTQPDEYYKTICNMGIIPNKKDFDFIVSSAMNKEIDYVLVLALVMEESRFRKNAINYNNNDTTDYGYFQLNDGWHDQYKEDVSKHISYGLEHLQWCLEMEFGDVKAALSRYNSGRDNSESGLEYAERVLKWKDIIMTRGIL